MMKRIPLERHDATGAIYATNRRGPRRPGNPAPGNRPRNNRPNAGRTPTGRTESSGSGTTRPRRAQQAARASCGSNGDPRKRPEPASQTTRP
eukprot:11214433-Lingulodinium_polyedra.AAC.1